MRQGIFPRGRYRPQKGQALVELALVMPLYLFLFFGLLEVSMVYATSALYSSAVYQAVRAEALAGSHDATVDSNIIQVISHTVHPLFMAQIQRIEIYRSNAQGAGPDGTHVTIFLNGATVPTQSWLMSDRVSQAQNPVYIGVRITYRYTWLTAFIGATGTTILLHSDSVSPLLDVGG